MASKKKGDSYNADSIKVLEAFEGIRKRYGMYIGSGGEEGVLRLFYEALGNAIDEFNAKRCKNIKVKVDARTSEIQVTDDGSGLPQQKIEEVCTKLHSGGKFEDEYSLISLGMNGVGLTVINALSEKLVMEVKRDGYHWKQTFSKGQPISKLKKVKEITKADGTGTTVTFIPDISVLGDVTINVERYANFIELSSYMNKGLTIDFVGINDDGKKITKKVCSKDGLLEYIKKLDNKFLLSSPFCAFESKEYEEITKVKTSKEGEKVKWKETKTGKKIYMDCEIIIQYSKNDTGIFKSFCNGLETSEGGSHDTGLRMGLTEVLVKMTKESNLLTKKDSNIEIIKDDVQEGIIALINVKHSDPVYHSQTKDKLNVPEVQWFTKKVVVDSLTKWLKANPTQAKIIYQRIIAAAKGRIAANRAKTDKKKKEAGLIAGLSSLSKIILATGNDASKKRMFIVEGKPMLNCSL